MTLPETDPATACGGSAEDGKRIVPAKPQRIFVFQQNGSGEAKIAGIREHGGDGFHLETFSIDVPLPPVIDDGRQFLPARIEADLVLDFLRHPDLSCDLAALCQRQKIPVVASGIKMRAPGVLTPPT
jgi:hypothetical protein